MAALQVSEKSQQVLIVVQLVEVGTDVIDAGRECLLQLLLVLDVLLLFISHFGARCRWAPGELAVHELGGVNDLAQFIAYPINSSQSEEWIRILPVRLVPRPDVLNLRFAAANCLRRHGLRVPRQGQERSLVPRVLQQIL